MKAISVALFAGAVGCAFVQLVPTAEAAKFKEEVLWSFGSGTDGQDPIASLIHAKGTLYSTTEFGGTYGEGTVFSLNLKTGEEKVLYSFCSQLHCADGQNPWGGLIDVKGILYGTTFSGGAGEYGEDGTVFALDPNTDIEKVVYSFCNQQNCTDGTLPGSSPIKVKGMLYGTAQDAGGGGHGTAYALDPYTGAYTVLYSFCSQQNCTDGLGPQADLINIKGTLYGTTYAGGTGAGCEGYGCGTVFSLDPRSGAEAVLHSFGTGTDGRLPEASPIDVNGKLYGTTVGGGTGNGGSCDPAFYGCGTVFSIDPNTGVEKVLYSFCNQPNCTDGANPLRNLIDVDGTLYGTTGAGGSAGCNGEGCGTVFSIDPNTGTEKVLYSFCSQQNCADGAGPMPGLIDINGTLYGTTVGGGDYGYGTVFALKQKG